NAAVDPALHARLDTLAQGLPASLITLRDEVTAVRAFHEYDAAANRACAHLWHQLDSCLHTSEVHDRLQLLAFAANHFTHAALASLLRRMVKGPAGQVQRARPGGMRKSRLPEVALPKAPGCPWGETGWLEGTDRGPLSRHQAGSRPRKKNDLPPISNLGELR